MVEKKGRGLLSVFWERGSNSCKVSLIRTSKGHTFTGNGKRPRLEVPPSRTEGLVGEVSPFMVTEDLVVTLYKLITTTLQKIFVRDGMGGGERS